MKNFPVFIDDTLIISRLAQKELFSIKGGTQFFPLVTSVSLYPFLANLPINIGLILEVIGDRIIRARLERGYFHQGIESNFSQTSALQTVFAMDRLHAAPIFYQVALLLALQDLFGAPSERHQTRLYTIALEISRIAHHLTVAKNVFYCLDLYSLAELAEVCLLILEKPISIFKYLTVDAEYKTISLAKMQSLLAEASHVVDELQAAIDVEIKLIQRLKRKGIVNLSMAGSMGLTGLFLRANRNYYDLRQSYSEKPLYETAPKTSVSEGGDAYARFTLRVSEIAASITWLKESLEIKPTFSQFAPIVIGNNFTEKTPAKKFTFFDLEGAEGDIKMGLFFNENDHTISLRLRSPAYFIAQAIPHLLSQSRIEELPVLLHSLGITAEEIDK